MKSSLSRSPISVVAPDDGTILRLTDTPDTPIPARSLPLCSEAGVRNGGVRVCSRLTDWLDEKSTRSTGIPFARTPAPPLSSESVPRMAERPDLA